jgi:hypothetical protein
MSAQARAAFERGSGSELQDTPSRPAKMKALHSSSALAVNFFDFWSHRSSRPLQHALGLENSIVRIVFEAQYPTGLAGNPPNLDVVIELSGGHIIGIESKYSEWLSPKPKGKEPFKPKYFPSGPGLWKERGLAESQELARRMRQGDVQFRYLDAPQLLKHSLGLANVLGDQFSLYYVYLNCPGKESAFHTEELNRFGQLVGEELRFRAVTYQGLLSALDREQDTDLKYLDYLRTRYCGNDT